MERPGSGWTEEQVAQFGLTWGVGGLIALMLYIIWNVAKESRAGRTGTVVLFFVLGLGIAGFLAKQVIQWLMGMR